MGFHTISHRVTLYLTITIYFNMSQCDLFFVILAIFLIKFFFTIWKGFPFYGVLLSWIGNSCWSKLAFSIGNIICNMNTKWSVHPTQTFGVNKRDGFERRGLQEIFQLSVSGLRWQKLYFLHHDVLHKDIIFTAMQRKREIFYVKIVSLNFFHFKTI